MGKRRPIIEQPDHSHYPDCAKRMTEIKDYSRSVMLYTAASCGILFVFSMLSIRFNTFYILISLFSVKSDVTAYFFQSAEIIALFLISYIACGEKKIFGIILSLLFAAMALGAIVVTDPVVFTICLIGLIKNRFVFSVYADQEMLKGIEGYPLFSEALIPHSPKSTNASPYKEEWQNRRADTREEDEQLEMPELGGSDIAGRPNSYGPESGKYCTISESTIKLGKG